MIDQPSLYLTLKAHDETAFGWEPGGLARWCMLIGADPAEIANAIGYARRHADALSGSPTEEWPTLAVRHPDDPDIRMVINAHDLTDAHELWADE